MAFGAFSLFEALLIELMASLAVCLFSSRLPDCGFNFPPHEVETMHWVQNVTTPLHGRRFSVKWQLNINNRLNRGRLPLICNFYSNCIDVHNQLLSVAATMASHGFILLGNLLFGPVVSRREREGILTSHKLLFNLCGRALIRLQNN